MPSVIAHYQELALKGKNRPWFLQQLLGNLRGVLVGLDVEKIRTPMGRVEIVLASEADREEARLRLSRVFGLANFSMASRAPLDVEAIAAAIVRDLPAGDVASFRVKVHRADRRFPVPSPLVEREIGARVVAARGWKVNLTAPALTIGVELLPGEAFYEFGKQPGAGGLPMGTAGRIVVLLSGGIDSPVAAWRMMRRGCAATFVHFHSYPFLSRESQDKVRKLTRVLTEYQLDSRLHLVPFGELQRQITLVVPSGMRVVVYRRLMLKIAERIARGARAKVLVTGDSLGQVASQTIENITAIDQATNLVVFRPLIGLDKQEIITTAERIGTYRISIEPDEDCCTLFTPRHPMTRARMDEVLAVEQTLPVDDMVATALSASVVERFAYPVVQSPVGRQE